MQSLFSAWQTAKPSCNHTQTWRSQKLWSWWSTSRPLGCNVSAHYFCFFGDLRWNLLRCKKGIQCSSSGNPWGRMLDMLCLCFRTNFRSNLQRSLLWLLFCIFGGCPMISPLVSLKHRGLRRSHCILLKISTFLASVEQLHGCRTWFLHYFVTLLSLSIWSLRKVLGWASKEVVLWLLGVLSTLWMDFFWWIWSE